VFHMSPYTAVKFASVTPTPPAISAALVASLTI